VFIKVSSFGELPRMIPSWCLPLKPISRLNRLSRVNEAMGVCVAFWWAQLNNWQNAGILASNQGPVDLRELPALCMSADRGRLESVFSPLHKAF